MAGFSTYASLRTAWEQGQKFQAVMHKSGASNAALSHYSLWNFTGQPTQGLYTGSNLTATACDDGSPVGGLEHGGNASPSTKHLIRISANAVTNSNMAPGYLLLYDRLLFYPGIDAASAANQALTNVTTLPRYTDGVGVMAWLEVTTAFGANTGTLTYGSSGYTNSAGQTGRQHGVTVLTLASSTINRLPHISGQVLNNNYMFLPLQAGDIGVRSFESIQFTSAHVSGACALVLGYPLAIISVPQFKINSEKDLIFNTTGLPRIYDGACLSCLFYSPAAVGSTVVYGLDMDFTWN